MSVTYLSEMVSPEFKLKEIDEDICFEPKDAEADRKYYGEDEVGPKQSQNAMVEIINEVLGRDAARFEDHNLLVKAESLEGFDYTVFGESGVGKRVVSARRTSSDNKFRAIVCVLDGMMSVTSKECGSSAEDYLDAVRELMGSVA
jgi:hypothetical protein